MDFTEMEKRLLFQADSREKAGVLDEIYWIGRYTKEPEKKQAARSLRDKLSAMSDRECRERVEDIQRNYRLPPGKKSIGERLAEARQRSGAEFLSGHDIMGLERFADDTRHMVIVDVLSDECPVGAKGEKLRLFLTEEGYGKMREGQEKGLVRIRNHAAVRNGSLYYDYRDRDRER